MTTNPLFVKKDLGSHVKHFHIIGLYKNRLNDRVYDTVKAFCQEKGIAFRLEAFSDGVSNTKSWYQMIQDFVETKVTAEELQNAALLFPYCTPTTKEAYYYRSIFESLFPGRADIIPGFWQPKWSADGEVKEYIDPSARVLGVY